MGIFLMRMRECINRANLRPALESREIEVEKLGLFTRAAALALVIFMIVAVHFTSGKGFFWTAGGLEYSLLILLVGLVFLIRGGGDYSLDRRLGREF